MGTKIGRNDKCPCGSGKKYKQCCLRADEAGVGRAPDPAGDRRFDDLARMPGVGLSPYVVARMVEDSEELENTRRTDPGWAARLWTPTKVAAMDTDTLLGRLEALGVTVTPSEFRKLAQSQTSAWRVSEVWGARERARLDADFLGLAACELWKRWCPSRPSIEMIDDWIHEGFVADDNFGFDTLEPWDRAWKAMRPAIRPPDSVGAGIRPPDSVGAGIRPPDSVGAGITPEMTTMEALGARFPGLHDLAEYLDGYLAALMNCGAIEPELRAEALQLCEDVRSWFTGEPELQEIFHGPRLDLMFELGRGEQAQQELIGNEPYDAEPYLVVAEAWVRQKRTADAIAVLEKAVRRKVRDLEEVREMLEELRGDVDPPAP